jgi:transcriptional regulator with XRE-family HTH domain
MGRKRTQVYVDPREDLRTARLKRELTQQKLAALSGIDQGRISKIENGEIKDPAFSTVRLLARALNMDPRDLRFARDDAA